MSCTETLPGVTPSFFFLDLRSAEAPRFIDFLNREAPGAKISETPMMRGRFVKLAGTPVDQVKASDKVAWALEGDRGVTFAATRARGLGSRSRASGGRRTMPGRRWSRWSRRWREGLGLKIGDTVVVNVLGRDISATVANFRKVNWRSYAINFVLVYSPNTFRGAPFSELVSTALPPQATGRTKEIALLRAAARDFPTVVSVRVRDALETIEGLVAKLALAIRAATGVALADLGAGARRRARRQPPRPARRRDDPEDPRRDANPPQR